jgi:long-chain acyl-CoA synthetase
MKPAATLPLLLHHNASMLGRRPAFREKRGGVWQALSWSEYASLVSRFAGGLTANGFGHGDKLAVLGDNRPHLYIALLAAQSLGGVGVPLSPDSEPEAIARMLAGVGASVVVAENAEQAEAVVAVKDRVPALRLVVQAQSHGMHQIDNGSVRTFDSVAVIEASTIDRSRPDDAALILCDDGAATTLSHADLLAMAEAMAQVHDFRSTDETLAWLPMTWCCDALSSLALALLAGFTCNCPERPETARGDLREIGPSILLAPPRVWEAMLGAIETRAAQATGLKRALLRHFQPVAVRAAQLRAAGEEVPLSLRLRHALGEILVYAPLRDQVGLSRLRWGGTGGEPITPRVLQGFRAVGVNLSGGQEMLEPTRVAEAPVHA